MKMYSRKSLKENIRRRKLRENMRNITSAKASELLDDLFSICYRLDSIIATLEDYDDEYGNLQNAVTKIGSGMDSIYDATEYLSYCVDDD